MELEVLEQSLSICRLRELPPELTCGELFFLAKTGDEVSLVCPTAGVPPETEAREDGWRALRIRGILDFSLVGILAPIAALLAEMRIGIFVVSTFNTDYILVKEESLSEAVSALGSAGYHIL